jgi:hypothetical protein
MTLYDGSEGCIDIYIAGKAAALATLCFYLLIVHVTYTVDTAFLNTTRDVVALGMS